MEDDIIFEPRHEYPHAPDDSRIYDCIVIGLGVSGYAAAMYAARLGLKVLIIGEHPGGTLSLTGKVENYPGFVSIDGQKLTQFLENHAMDYDVDFLIDIVDGINKQDDLFHVRSGNRLFKGTTAILATGGSVKKLGVPGEKEFFGKGVGYCALCEAAYIKGKEVAVAGGGDSAVKEAILVAEYARKVYIINNEEDLHPEEHNLKILKGKVEEGKIETINCNEIVQITGDEKLKGLVLKNEYRGSKELLVDGLFIYVGHEAKSGLAKEIDAKVNDKGEVIVDKHAETNIKGFFASGDVTDTDWKQAIIGVSQGVTAAYYAYQHVKGMQ